MTARGAIMHAMLSRRWVRLVLATALLVIAPLVGLVAGSEVATSTCQESGESGEVLARPGVALPELQLASCWGGVSGCWTSHCGRVPWEACVVRGARAGCGWLWSLATGPSLPDRPRQDTVRFSCGWRVTQRDPGPQLARQGRGSRHSGAFLRIEGAGARGEN